MAADQGQAQAQASIGRAYLNGRGVPQDYAEAVRWFRLAADQGNARGQAGLGLMYAYGREVSQDYVAAHMWLNLAAAQLTGERGDAGAKARDQIAQSMTREQIAEAQRLAREWKPTSEP